VPFIINIWIEARGADEDTRFQLAEGILRYVEEPERDQWRIAEWLSQRTGWLRIKESVKNFAGNVLICIGEEVRG